MHSVAFASDKFDLSCMLCAECSVQGVDELGRKDDPVFVCCACLSVWHRDCAEVDCVMSRAFKAVGELKDAHVVGIASYDAGPHAFFCPFCAHVRGDDG